MGTVVIYKIAYFIHKLDGSFLNVLSSLKIVNLLTYLFPKKSGKYPCAPLYAPPNLDA